MGVTRKPTEKQVKAKIAKVTAEIEGYEAQLNDGDLEGAALESLMESRDAAALELTKMTAFLHENYPQDEDEDETETDQEDATMQTETENKPKEKVWPETGLITVVGTSYMTNPHTRQMFVRNDYKKAEIDNWIKAQVRAGIMQIQGFEL